MLIVIIFLIIGVILGGVLLDDGFIGALAGIVIGLLIASIIGDNFEIKEITNKQEICALNDTSKVEGQKYLFSGYVDEKLVYRYVIETKKGKCIKECKSDNTYLKEKDCNPYIETHEYTLKKDWQGWFGIRSIPDTYRVFYVPENTVTNEYNVDLK